MLASSEDSDVFWETCYDMYLDAALNGRNQKERRLLFEKIALRFPNSQRVALLRFVGLEADGMLRSAFEGYSSLGATNAFARKRILDMHRKTDDDVAREKSLSSFLEVFQSDEEAWAELSSVYASKEAWKQALFCSEEVILAKPGDCKVLCDHASLLLASGDVALARSYFCRASELDTKSLPALRGLETCLARSRVPGDEQISLWVERKLRDCEMN